MKYRSLPTSVRTHPPAVLVALVSESSILFYQQKLALVNKVKLWLFVCVKMKVFVGS